MTPVLSRRRALEIAVAAILLLLLLSVLFVRPTSRRTSPPAIPLFISAPGAAPDFGAEGFEHRAARSPDGTRSAVLYPVDFEVATDLYLVTGPGEGRHFVLADSLRADFNPKAVGWIDGRMLWVTLGWLYGTVSPGGELLAVDPATGAAAPLWASPDSARTQAVAARARPDGSLEVFFRVFDANMDHPRDSTGVLPREVVEAARAALHPPGSG